MHVALRWNLVSWCQVASGYREPVPSWWPASIQALIARCWSHDPHQRPHMSSVLAELKVAAADPAVLAIFDQAPQLIQQDAAVTLGEIGATTPAEKKTRRGRGREARNEVHAECGKCTIC
jgi:Protein tyrosine and serine/threonine kinase